MSDIIIMTGDMVQLDNTFGKATMMGPHPPGQMKGSAKAKIGGNEVCVEGNEADLKIPGCPYTASPYADVPGVAMGLIEELDSAQVATKTKSGDKAVILKGKKFKAKLKVTMPAQMIDKTTGAPVPDATPEYSGGTGSFMSMNATVKGT